MTTSSSSKDAIIYHGRFCKSGIASRFTLYEARCITVTNVTLSTDKNNSLSSPFKCRADGTVTCTYSSNYTSALFILPCECGNDGSTGYCPFPD